MKKNQNRLHAFFASAIVLLATTTAAFAQSKAEKIDQLISKYSEYGQFNGSALVSEHGKVLFKKGYGMANMEWQIANQPDTKHRLGSITKQFTAMLVLQLVQQGKLKLDVPITTYLPDYPKATGDRITIHQLLTHTSGIPNYTDFPDFFKEKSRDPYTPEAFVKTFSDLPLQFTPGEKFSYSNSGYFLLGYLIEKASGKSYETCLEENIFRPLKMSNSGFDRSEKILKNRAAGYEKRGDNYINTSYIDMSIPYAAGSMYSTVEDLYLWDQALYTEQLLPAKFRDLLFKNYIAVGRNNESYGYGWFLYDIPNEKNGEKIKVIEHGGGINGFNTIISRIPADQDLIVLLNNTGGANLGQMREAIRNILYDKPYEMPKRSLANAFVATILEKGLPAGMDKFKALKADETYALREGEMNSVGYELLQRGKIKEAIEVFKINTETFPKSGNAYDSLGEAYLKDGNKKMAIDNYKKSIVLDPENENGKEVLKGLLKK